MQNFASFFSSSQVTVMSDDAIRMHNILGCNRRKGRVTNLIWATHADFRYARFRNHSPVMQSRSVFPVPVLRVGKCYSCFFFSKISFLFLCSRFRHFEFVYFNWSLCCSLEGGRGRETLPPDGSLKTIELMKISHRRWIKGEWSLHSNFVVFILSKKSNVISKKLEVRSWSLSWKSEVAS